MSGKSTLIFVGWVERSETQHQLLYFVGFRYLNPTYTDAIFVMGNQSDMI